MIFLQKFTQTQLVNLRGLFKGYPVFSLFAGFSTLFLIVIIIVIVPQSHSYVETFWGLLKREYLKETMDVLFMISLLWMIHELFFFVVGFSIVRWLYKYVIFFVVVWLVKKFVLFVALYSVFLVLCYFYGFSGYNIYEVAYSLLVLFCVDSLSLTLLENPYLYDMFNLFI